MKNIILFYYILLLVVFSCSNPSAKEKSLPLPAHKMAEQESRADMAVIDFKKTSHDFGKVEHGEVLEYTFVFTNTGKSDLVIYAASASCGCTVPEYDKNLIAPGQQGKVKIVFNTRGFRGAQSKTITITSNASNAVMNLFVTANIHV
jgi:hypothetical protein